MKKATLPRISQDETDDGVTPLTMTRDSPRRVGDRGVQSSSQPQALEKDGVGRPATTSAELAGDAPPRPLKSRVVTEKHGVRCSGAQPLGQGLYRPA